MPTMIFSNESRYWRPLCAGPLYPETSVPGPGNCEICIKPVDINTLDPGVIPEPEPEPGVGGP